MSSRNDEASRPASRAGSPPSRAELARRRIERIRRQHEESGDTQLYVDHERRGAGEQNSELASNTIRGQDRALALARDMDAVFGDTSFDESSGPSANASSLNSPSPLVRSLLETADRIAQAPVLDLNGHEWTEGRHNEDARQSFHSRQTSNVEDPSDSRVTASSNEPTNLSVPTSTGRIRLTRRYTGRPHVPGEDSGSDTGEEEGVSHMTTNNARDRNVQTNSRSTSGSQRRSLRLVRRHIHGEETDSDSEPQMRQLHPESGRQATVEQGIQETRGRDTPPSPPTTYATSGPTPTRGSFYDWAPVRRELERARQVPIPNARSRSRSRSQSSVRRWRPSESTTTHGPRPIILLDGRHSDHRDRVESNREQSPQNQDQSNDEVVDAAIRSARAAINTSRNAIVERSSDAERHLDRVLREYRTLRRVLRSQSQNHNLDDAEREVETGTSTTGPARRIWQSPRRFSVQPWQPQTGSESNATRPTVHDVSDNSAQNDRNGRRLGEVDAAVPFSILSQRAQDAIEEQRRERQFIREWVVRNRPRNYQQLRESAGQAQPDDNTIATGPLFNRDPSMVLGRGANSGRTSGDGAARFSGERYRRIMETHKRQKRAAEEHESPAHRKAKATIQYITQLREIGADQSAAWDLVTCLGLYSDGLSKDTPLDLPMSIRDLPMLAGTSWLQSGVVWKGSQCAGNADEGARLLHARARRHRERIRGEREERERVESAQRQNESFLQRTGERGVDPLERTIIGSGSSFLSWSDSMRVPEDAERLLSTMLDQQNERLQDDEGWGSSTAGERRLLLGEPGFSRRGVREPEEDEEPPAAAIKPESEDDHWNVKVTIHEVDWDDMTLTGTMSASQLPDRTRMGMGYQPLESTPAIIERESGPYGQKKTSTDNDDDVSMDSFFTGHIIDFRNNHTLHTTTSFGWKVGGLETDMSYWAGIGPFREEIENELEVQRAEKGVEKLKAAGEDKYCGDVLSDEEKEETKKAVMARCLGSKKWLERNLGDGGCGGWVLMRWKEQCFVTPGPEPNPQTINASNVPSASGTSFSPPGFFSRNSNGVWDTSTLTNTTRNDANPNSAIWGLTISGFYYVALHRLTGKIEALYFDPGSQPYQRLRMVPEAEYPGILKRKESSDFDLKFASMLGGRHGVGNTAGGLRSAFPLVELR